MTNYERLLDLPLREVINEFDKDADIKDWLVDALSFMMQCNGIAPPCKLCKEVDGSCGTVCGAWLDREAEPDANYNDDVWRDTDYELPASSDSTLEYIVLVSGAELPTTLVFDGENWLDNDANHYRVKYWRPMPELPQNM